jgi:hypothetical protein
MVNWFLWLDYLVVKVCEKLKWLKWLKIDEPLVPVHRSPDIQPLFA